MIRVEYFIATGSGAPQHRYGSGRGVGISRSPKTALRLARAAATNTHEDWINWGTILEGYTLTNLSTGATIEVGDFIPGGKHD